MLEKHRRAGAKRRIVKLNFWRIPGCLLAAAIVFESAAHAQAKDDTAAPGASLAVEADAAAYALKGYSGIFRVTLANGFNIAFGSGRYNVPNFVVKGQDNYEQARWKATSESIQVLRVGYRFRGPMRDGPVVDAIVLNQKWRLRSERVAGETRFRPIGVGLSGGYYIHLGRHFYIYPTASLTHNSVYSGTTSLQGFNYRVPKFQFNGSVHVGWEWGL